MTRATALLTLLILTIPVTSLAESLDGRPAPGFTLEKYGGGTMSLESLKGKIVVLNFWATWCGPCKDEMPLLNEANEKFRDNDVLILGVNYQQTSKSVDRFAEKIPLDFPQVLDKKGDLVKQYEVAALPTTFFIGKDGNIITSHIGGLNYDILFDTIKAIIGK